MSNILIAYFSCSGVTKSVAQSIANVTGGDLFEIEPKQPYTSADLNWMDKNSRSTVEMKNPNSRPEIAKTVPNMEQYDTIYVGFPIWWYVAPTIINTFIESYNLSGKTIVPFATSGGSGAGKTVEVLKKSSPNANWKPCKLLNHTSKDSIASWINSL